MASSIGESVVVWGNCQAGPIAELLAPPLAQHGLRVIAVPPVYLIDQAGLRRAEQAVADAAFLLSQPVTNNYRLPGCGTQQLASHLGPRGTLVTFPVMLHVGAFPYQVRAHGADGERVDAPLTDYHDLRAVVAAERGMALAEALDWWPEPGTAEVQTVAAQSLARLQARDVHTDVATAHLADAPSSLWTMTHPTNEALAAVAGALLKAISVTAERTADVSAPQREFLGARRAPLEEAVVRGRKWPAGIVRPEWVIDGQPVPLPELLQHQLAFYRMRPDVIVDCRTRYAERLGTLQL